MKNRFQSLRLISFISIVFVILFQFPFFCQAFKGFDSSTLDPVTNTPGEWGLKIIVLNVGQADAILVMTPNGEVALIDSAKFKSIGHQIADILSSSTLNGVGNIGTIDLLYTTHYDQDHIGGIPGLVEREIRIRKAFDQGISKKRKMTTSTGKPSYYAKYAAAVGDPNNNLIQDANESDFVRHKLHFGHVETIGQEDEVDIRCIAVRGDTKGNSHDLDLDPSDKKIDENPGSIALLIRLGEFEFYTAGDQTDNDWKSKKAVEESVLDSGAIVGGHDIDVIKVNHHGSDTSTSKDLADKMIPEVAIISTKFTKGDKLPKKIALKQFQDNDTYVLITGDGLNPDTQDYTDAGTNSDNGFTALDAAVFNNQGNVTVLVSKDGDRYTVIGGSFAKTFSSYDNENQRDSN